jgi:hypothetical protein
MPYDCETGSRSDPARSLCSMLSAPKPERNVFVSVEGPIDAEQMIFEANLREFATRVGFVCALESNQSISQREAYQRIKALWKQLKESRKNLRIGEDEP